LRVLRGPRFARRRRQEGQDRQGHAVHRRPPADGRPLSALASALPDSPWDLLEPAKAKAAAHPGGIVDLSVGTPVDPVPELIREALNDASDASGYPLTAGTPALRAAIAGWLAR